MSAADCQVMDVSRVTGRPVGSTESEDNQMCQHSWCLRWPLRGVTPFHVPVCGIRAAMMVQSADVRVLQIATKARDDSRCGVWQQAKASSSAPEKRVGIRVYLPFKVMVTR